MSETSHINRKIIIAQLIMGIVTLYYCFFCFPIFYLGIDLLISLFFLVSLFFVSKYPKIIVIPLSLFLIHQFYYYFSDILIYLRSNSIIMLEGISIISLLISFLLIILRVLRVIKNNTIAAIFIIISLILTLIVNIDLGLLTFGNILLKGSHFLQWISIFILITSEYYRN